MQKNKGFTLIELLVVIAIIGILSSVVLASLNSARNKGADAAIKSNLANLRAQAEIYYDGTGAGSYGSTSSTCTVSNLGVFNPTTCPTTTTSVASVLSQGAAAAASASGATVNFNSTGTAWAAFATLKATTGVWCVDSTGASRISTATVTTTAC